MSKLKAILLIDFENNLALKNKLEAQSSRENCSIEEMVVRILERTLNASGAPDSAARSVEIMDKGIGFDPSEKRKAREAIQEMESVDHKSDRDSGGPNHEPASTQASGEQRRRDLLDSVDIRKIQIAALMILSAIAAAIAFWNW